MKRILFIASSAIALLIILAACSPAAAPTPTAAPEAAAPSAEPTHSAMSDENMSDENMSDENMSGDDMSGDYNGPAWASLELVDARSGQTFTLADFAGRTVYVEPMATWCSNCRAQLRRVRDAIPQLDSEQVVFIGLSVEAGLSPDVLAQYQETQGFDWTFAAATPELLDALVAEFGRTVNNPPATPHFLIGPDGSLSGLSTGSHSPEQIVAMVQAAAAQ